MTDKIDTQSGWRRFPAPGRVVELPGDTRTGRRGFIAP
jgi:hypothetical protein